MKLRVQEPVSLSLSLRVRTSKNARTFLLKLMKDLPKISLQIYFP